MGPRAGRPHRSSQTGRDLGCLNADPFKALGANMKPFLRGIVKDNPDPFKALSANMKLFLKGIVKDHGSSSWPASQVRPDMSGLGLLKSGPIYSPQLKHEALSIGDSKRTRVLGLAGLTDPARQVGIWAA